MFSIDPNQLPLKLPPNVVRFHSSFAVSSQHQLIRPYIVTNDLTMANADLKKIFGFVDDNKEKFIKTLGEAIEIKSVSAWPQNREVRKFQTRIRKFIINYSFVRNYMLPF